MTAKKSAPSVLEYLDLLSYLQSYYSYRKSQDKNFSYESWSQELEFNKTRSFLRMVVIGKKKASPSFIEAFCRLNFSTLREEEYFQFLVKYSQAATASEKQLFGQKLISILKTDNSENIIAEYTKFVSSPLIPRVLTLTSFKDVYPTAETYARLLKTPLPEIQRALSLLKDMDLIESSVFEGETLWKAKTSRFKVPDNQGSIDLLSFHEKSLHEAIGAFKLPKALRRYQSLILVMSDEDLEVLYKLLDDFGAEQIARFTPDFYEGKRVFQMNFNVHAVSEPEASRNLVTDRQERPNF